MSVFLCCGRVYNVGLPLNMQERAIGGRPAPAAPVSEHHHCREGNLVSQPDPLTVIVELQRSRRRWRLLALGLLALLVVLFFTVALTTIVGWGRVNAERMRALEAMERAE
jgi:disulfide bond formation protein DsbB